MAGSSAVLEDGSVLSRLDRQLFKLESLMALISGLRLKFPPALLESLV